MKTKYAYLYSSLFLIERVVYPSPNEHSMYFLKHYNYFTVCYYILISVEEILTCDLIHIYDHTRLLKKTSFIIVLHRVVLNTLILDSIIKYGVKLL